MSEFVELCNRLANTYGINADKRSNDLERSLESLISKVCYLCWSFINDLGNRLCFR